jgi:hypothetical protein
VINPSEKTVEKMKNDCQVRYVKKCYNIHFFEKVKLHIYYFIFILFIYKNL